MIFWVILAMGLNVILIMAIYQGASSESILTLAYAILLVVLGVLYRAFLKLEKGELETLDDKFDRLSKENDNLKRKVGFYKEKFGEIDFKI